VRTTLGIDIGGSGIKAAIVDTATGELLTDRRRLATPKVSTPQNIAATVRRLVSTFDYDGPIGCCFPAVIVDGEARTAGNIDDAWLGTNVAEVFGAATGHVYSVLNDADGAGLAEMRLGAGKDLDGLVLIITIGTGIGSGMFYNGELVPNLEIGWMPSDMSRPMERYVSDRARKVDGLTWDEWAERFNYFLAKTVRVFSPDHFILGGGGSKRFARYRHGIDVATPIHVAKFRNNAGIVGAAMEAARRAGAEGAARR
jgi:polyphosphate glucokinase